MKLGSTNRSVIYRVHWFDIVVYFFLQPEQNEMTHITWYETLAKFHTHLRETECEYKIAMRIESIKLIWLREGDKLCSRHLKKCLIVCVCVCVWILTETATFNNMYIPQLQKVWQWYERWMFLLHSQHTCFYHTLVYNLPVYIADCNTISMIRHQYHTYTGR